MTQDNTTTTNLQLVLSSLQTASQNWIGFEYATKQSQWDATCNQNKEAREQSQAARKHLAETTKQFKRSVKSVEQAGSSLSSSNTPENATTTVKAIETLAKNCRLTVKAYQGKRKKDHPLSLYLYTYIHYICVWFLLTIVPLSFNLLFYTNTRTYIYTHRGNR